MALKEEIFSHKVSIDELREIWNDEEREYTDEELQKIRSWLYAMAEITVEIFRGNRGGNLKKK